MSRKNKVSASVKNTAKTVAKNPFSEIKWGESYMSLILGILVVCVAVLFVFIFVRNRQIGKAPQDVSSLSTEKIAQKTYEVKEGEDLWSISEKLYGAGDNWVELAKFNKIENPDILYTGTKLSLPEIKPKIIAQAKAEVIDPNGPIKGNTYKVQEGDDLWNIAVRAYGDGYKWVEIAEKNNITNPDLIYVDTVLNLPR